MNLHCQCLSNLQIEDPKWGYYPQPKNSILVVKMKIRKKQKICFGIYKSKLLLHIDFWEEYWVTQLKNDN